MQQAFLQQLQTQQRQVRATDRLRESRAQALEGLRQSSVLLKTDDGANSANEVIENAVIENVATHSAHNTEVQLEVNEQGFVDYQNAKHQSNAEDLQVALMEAPVCLLSLLNQPLEQLKFGKQLIEDLRRFLQAQLQCVQPQNLRLADLPKQQKLIVLPQSSAMLALLQSQQAQFKAFSAYLVLPSLHELLSDVSKKQQAMQQLRLLLV